MASTSILSPDARRLEGKVALVTGGAGGIGEATVRLFCRHGAKVVVADVQDDKGRSLCLELGPDAAYVHCDVTEEDDVRDAVDLAVATYGKLDVMFNNAGVVGRQSPHILDTEKSAFERVIAVNLTGVFLGTKHAARVMVPAGKGSIIMTASICSLLGGHATYAYTCSKHALVGLAKDAAAELGRHGVRVNCVSPYLVATGLTREGYGLDDAELEASSRRHANLKGTTLTADDVAEAVLYLAGDESKYVSGHNLVVDGGFTVVNHTSLSSEDW